VKILKRDISGKIKITLYKFKDEQKKFEFK